MSASTSTSLEEAIDAAKQGRRTVMLCPAHNDHSPSLSISPGDKQPVVLKCHTGCDPQDILDAAGVPLEEVLNPREDFEAEDRRPVWTPAGETDPSLVYTYRDVDGTELYQVLRVHVTNADGKPGKRFLQRRPDPASEGRYLWHLDDVKRVPFNLPQMVAAIEAGATIHIAEGEKCVRALEAVIPSGDVATCNSGGAGKWLGEWNHYFVPGTSVIVYADADDPGRQHAREVRENLTEAGCTVRTVEAPPGQLRGGKAISDVADHLEAGRPLSTLLETTPQSDAERARTGVDILDLVRRERVSEEFVIEGTLAKGERMLLVGLEGRGKALSLDTMIPTPSGWTTMEKVAVGDRVYAHDGSITEVVAETEVMHDRPCYRVTFDDGAEVIADGEHLWLTETRRARETAAVQAKRKAFDPAKDQRHKIVHRESVVTTEQVRDTLRHHSGSINHSVRTCGWLKGRHVDLPIAPYALGAWLGDGHSTGARITVHPDDEQIVEEVRGDGWVVTQRGQMLWSITSDRKWHDSLSADLRSVGVHGNKHIPDEYLRASSEQRLALLQGLMDTDGTIQKSGRCEFSVTNERLALGVLELLRTFGIKATLNIGAATVGGRIVGQRYRLAFQPDGLPVFRLARKRERIKRSTTRRAHHRFIMSVEPVESVPVKCIQVAHEAGTYLITDQMIPTHNSTLLRQVAVMTAAGLHPFFGTRMDPKRVLFIDAENHPNQVTESWGNLVGLCVRHASPVEQGMLTVLEEWDAERDLTSVEGQTWLKERVYGYRPDLLILGPLTNLVERDLSDYDQVNRLRRSVNSVRDVCNSAIIMEHHAPLRANGDKIREVRPYGNGLFLKWPDYGYAMVPTDDDEVYEWRANRGPRVRSRRFPEALRQGNQHTNSIEFPWMSDMMPGDVR